MCVTSGLCSHVAHSVACFPPKATPPIDPERQWRKPAPANPHLVRSQAPRDPLASAHGPQQPRLSPLTSGPQMRARAPSLDGGLMVPHVKSLNNNPAPAVAHSHSMALHNMVISTITHDDAEAVPMQQTSSTSGSSPSPKNNRNKKVCCIYYDSCSGGLTSNK